MSHDYEPPAKRQRTDNSDTHNLSSSTLQAAATAGARPWGRDPRRIIDAQRKVNSMSARVVQAAAMQFVAEDTSGQFTQFMERLYADQQARVPRAWESLFGTTDPVRRADEGPVFSFTDPLQRSVYCLNANYAGLGRSKQLADQAQAELEAALDDIVARTGRDSGYATKKRAVDVMRDIFLSMMREPSGVVLDRRGLRGCLRGWDAKFLRVMGTFAEDELERLAGEDSGAWLGGFRALVAIANEHCVLEKLQECLDDLDAYRTDGGCKDVDADRAFDEDDAGDDAK